MTTMSNENYPKWFNPEITLGHILTMVAIIVPGIVWGVRLEGRVDNQKEVIDNQKEVAALQQENNMLRFTQITQEVANNKQEREKSMSRIDESLRQISDDVGKIKVNMEKKVDR